MGKSGAGTWAINSSTLHWGLSIRCSVALITSVMLWGGMRVAIPTAMPSEPLTSRFGKRAGRTSGSWRLSS